MLKLYYSLKPAKGKESVRKTKLVQLQKVRTSFNRQSAYSAYQNAFFLEAYVRLVIRATLSTSADNRLINFQAVVKRKT